MQDCYFSSYTGSQWRLCVLLLCLSLSLFLCFVLLLMQRSSVFVQTLISLFRSEVTAQGLALLLHIREVPGSNLGLEIV
jgi:hypothetical protein